MREVPQPHVGTGHAGPQGESEVFQHADDGGASARSTGRVSDLYGDVRRRAALGRVDGPGSGRRGPVGGRGIGRRGQNPAGRGIPYWVASGGGRRLRRAVTEAAGRHAGARGGAGVVRGGRSGGSFEGVGRGAREAGVALSFRSFAMPNARIQEVNVAVQRRTTSPLNTGTHTGARPHRIDETLWHSDMQHRFKLERDPAQRRRTSPRNRRAAFRLRGCRCGCCCGCCCARAA